MSKESKTERKSYGRYLVVVLLSVVAIVASLLFAKKPTVPEPETEPGATYPWEIEISSEEEQEGLLYFTDTPPENMSGLRLYFFHKLIINPKKVEKYLNVRREPSEVSTILAVLFDTDVVTYIAKKGSWYLIEKDGMFGYVKEDFVLTDGDAYETFFPTIGYRAMVSNPSAYLYTDPNNENSGIYQAGKSETFRVTGLTGDSYQVERKDDSEKHYLKKDQALLYFVFLGRNADNGLKESDEILLASLDIYLNLEKKDAIASEAAAERYAYEAALASREVAERQQEEERKKQQSSTPTAPYVPPTEPETIAYTTSEGEDGIIIPHYSVNGVVCPIEYQDYVYQLCVAFGIGWYYPYFILQMYQESKFNQNARNYHPEDGTTDVGICQIKDKYHEGYKMRCGHPEFDLYNNALDNIYVGVFIIAQNLQYNNNQIIPAMNDYFYGAGSSVSEVWSDYPNHVLSWQATMVQIN